MNLLKQKENLLTADYLRSQLSYNPETGEFRWKTSRAMNKIKPGDIAGSVHKIHGYRVIALKLGHNSYLFKAHRLAWLYIYGVWPDKQLDHIDRNRSNNRINNLREATNIENQRNQRKLKNRTSRFMGVCQRKGSCRWTAGITLNGKNLHIGFFDSEEDAALAYNRAALERDPSFNNLNEIP